MIMRFRPANIRLINRRSNLPRLLLALSSGKSKNNDNDKNNPIDSAELTRSLHIQANALIESSNVDNNVARPSDNVALQNPFFGSQVTDKWCAQRMRFLCDVR
jgi:hypothetical protein